MTQICSAGRFHSHKAPSTGSSAVCSFACCSDVNKFGTWLLCCVTELSSISRSVSKCQSLGAPEQLIPEQGEQRDNKCSLKRTKPLGDLLPCIIIYAPV